MQARIENVRIKGFRSLVDVQLTDLPMAAVLIGANGSGKSNIIRFFEMLVYMLRDRRLDAYVAGSGGASDQLFDGAGVTTCIDGEVALRILQQGGPLHRPLECRHEYGFRLGFVEPDRLTITEERIRFKELARLRMPVEDFRTAPEENRPGGEWEHLPPGNPVPQVVVIAQTRHCDAANRANAKEIVQLLGQCGIYRFHDTSYSSGFKTLCDASDWGRLARDGGNLAAVLLHLEREDVRRYELICEHIARVLPMFDRFRLDEVNGKVMLRWVARASNKTLGPHLTSDGSLRFFALVTLLNLPDEHLPSVMMLDEPELGLHPDAISLVGGMIQAMSAERQIVVASQSPRLVDAFELDQVVVVDLESRRTVARQRLPQAEYQAWLDDGLRAGGLWTKNLIGGNP